MSENLRVLVLSLFFLAPVASLSAVASAETAPAKPSKACYARQDLAARSQGFVERVLVKDGDVVTKGTLLVQLDDRLLNAGRKEAAAGVKAAKADVRLADDAFTRLKQLQGTDAVTAQELVQAEVKLEQAKAKAQQAAAVLERVDAQLSDTRVTAAVDGRVHGLPTVQGLFVQAGQSLGRVEATSSPCDVTQN